MAANKPICVQIMDDHDLIVAGIKSILQDEPDIETVSVPVLDEAGALEAIRACQPDVLLLDARMPDFDLLSALDKIRALFPRVRVIVVTAQQDPYLVRAAAKHGTAGYVLKEEGLSSLLPMAIREVAQGKSWYSPRASQHLFQEPPAPQILNDYQYEVLRLMVCGKTPREIGHALQRSVGAIYSAQETIRNKLGTSSNDEAIVIAIRDSLVPLADIQPTCRFPEPT
jgi:DNA-binding NarL/FixJ family response regulator